MADDFLTPEQERAIRDLFEQASLNDYPNPDRTGCPSDNFLKQLVRDRSSIKLTDERLKHVVRCSPCFREFVAFRDKAKHKTTTRRAIFAGAGSLAAAVAIASVVTSKAAMRGHFKSGKGNRQDKGSYKVPEGVPAMSI